MSVNNFENELFRVVGEAVCKIQDLEDCLNHAILLKTFPRATPKSEADQKLDDYRNKYKYTFGQAINLAEEKDIFKDSILNSLKSFKKDRNWLVHKSIAPYRGRLITNSLIKDLFARVKRIAFEANDLCCTLEEDLISYCSSRRADMSEAKLVLDSFRS